MGISRKKSTKRRRKINRRKTKVMRRKTKISRRRNTRRKVSRRKVSRRKVSWRKISRGGEPELPMDDMIKFISNAADMNNKLVIDELKILKVDTLDKLKRLEGDVIKKLYDSVVNLVSIDPPEVIPMNIINLRGEKFSLEMKPDETVSNLKKYILGNTLLNPGNLTHINLVYRGNILNGSETILDVSNRFEDDTDKLTINMAVP